MAVLLQDDFNRANSTNAIGSPTVGGPYTVRLGTWGINNNALYTSASTAESHVTFPAATDVDITWIPSVIGSNSGVIFRFIDSNNFWLVQHNSTTNLNVYRRIGGTYNTFASVVFPASQPLTGATMRVVTLGRDVWVLRDGKLAIRVEDVWHASAGNTGAGFRHSSDTTSRIDTITASDNTTSPVADQASELVAEGWVVSTYGPQAGLYKGRDTALADEGNVP